MNTVELIEREQMRMDLPDFIPGDTVNIRLVTDLWKAQTFSHAA